MLTRKTVILAKIEETYGTDLVPTVSANAILAKDVNIRPIGEIIERDFIKGSLSRLPFLRGVRHVEISFATEMKGTGERGTLPAWGWEGVLFRACGMQESVTSATKIEYLPVSNAFESCTLYVYKHGIFHKVTGCRGSFRLRFEVGKFPSVEWTFKGLFTAPADSTPGAQTFSSVKPVPCLGSAFSVGSYQGIIQALEIDLNATVSERKSINSATGIIGFEVTDRQPQGSFDPEVVTEATYGFWTKWASASGEALSIGPIGTESGNIINVTAPALQFRDITYGDRAGQLTYEVPFALAMSSGDDELKITIT